MIFLEVCVLAVHHIHGAPLVDEPSDEASSPVPASNQTSSSNFTAPAHGGVTCYDRSDSLFFSLMAGNYSQKNCLKQIPKFARKIRALSRQDITFWYTSSHERPRGMQKPALQMPVFRNDEGCSAAIVSTKLLNEFTIDKGFAWREEWGGRRPWEIVPTVIRERAYNVVSIEGVWAMLECSRGGDQMAGHVQLGMLRALQQTKRIATDGSLQQVESCMRSCGQVSSQLSAISSRSREALHCDQLHQLNFCLRP